MGASTEISFIVPAYNEETELGSTLQALIEAGDSLAETYEIIVADDGSTDRTAAIAREHGAQVITARHRQIAATRNSGAANASGEIFIFVDADTVVNDEVVQAAIKAVRNGSSGGGAAVTLAGPLPWYGRLIAALFVRGYRLTGWAAGCFMFCTRQAFEAIGGFDEKLFGAEEIEFSKALTQLGTFTMLSESVLSSSRKMRLYSVREHFRTTWRFLRRGSESLYDRDNMQMWYEGRREAESHLKVANNNPTGFCVPYNVRTTPDKGRGVFADAPISKGTILWRHVRGQYAVYDERSLMELLARLSHSEVVYELEHMFGLPEFPGYVIRVFDDGVLINHSRQPNVAMNSDSQDHEISYNTSPQDTHEVEDALLNDRFTLIAKQDLKVGDELTMDYNIGTEEPSYYDALYEQYGVSEPWL